MKAWHEATWVDPDARQRKRRFSWGWLWLLLIPAALVTFSVALFNDYWQHGDWTVTTYSCDEPLAADPTWADLQAAGCAEQEIPGAEVTLIDGGTPTESDERDGAVWVFRDLPTAFSTMGLNVQLDEPAGRVFVVDGSTEPPSVHREMTASDVARTLFARNLGSLDSTDLYAVVAPAE